jgi:HEAT repeat protein
LRITVKKIAVQKIAGRLVMGCCLLPALQAQTVPPSPAPSVETQPSPSLTPSLPDQSWGILQTGAKDSSSARRASAVRVLSLLRGEPRAISLASRALEDPQPAVRAAGAVALGELHAVSAIPKLKKMLAEKETPVVIAASRSLLLMKDQSGYAVYYAILMGDRKGEGLIAGQLAILKDPKKMAAFGFREGIGFVPYADMGYGAFRTITKDGSEPVRIASAKALVDDPDPLVEDALLQTALSDKSELVRAAALDALAQRGQPGSISKIGQALSDQKDSVRFTAAAVIIHLAGRKHPQPGKPAASQP